MGNNVIKQEIYNRKGVFEPGLQTFANLYLTRLIKFQCLGKPRQRQGPQKHLTTDIKNEIVNKYYRKNPMSRATIARMLGLSWTTVNNVVEKYAKDGTVEPKPRGGSRKKS
ncbi:Homeodomain-like DNA binding domain-containing transcription factor [Phycomyces blakesleeanus NRRL 1555(-)]|uniref:Homeodomain-like DNA binding domain-containing transcription factor n=1 Tax=Phycomyces blakesleeanus (strain ATCC 8743b / DSM 1359 / FGSC 10004 / NBRC 33097 / NRRL 1555) TaxID=763407 RepID=A0A162V8Q0_PHYB8|nr:Homeodomain-like DNA binding domain-containing transcription factor [Phycomyces blakesleeanus NRRL 1555(-)]OAD80822.1 Homeodomain-like DNA binding domain-containing transcription factor [Phycomyces blakesleeanus NRRL 1555(-)]|eukprot:XP_018298862.1 Homeodomain-like DNA binding domain-containing transcription factor [Phycomyces blakesleeanus NRRL 1555(-)]